MFSYSNKALEDELSAIAEVAGYLWQKNWAECNGGNISVNLTNYIENKIFDFVDLNAIEIEQDIPALANNAIYITGAGKRMRDVAKSPLENGAIILISSDAKTYKIITNEQCKPSSELSSHLLIQEYFIKSGSAKRAILHTHPIELIALSHCCDLAEESRISKILCSMLPEAKIVAKCGVGFIDYILPGTNNLAIETLNKLKSYDIVIWQKHGAIAIGDSIIDCFDLIDTLNKSAQIYLTARNAGFEPIGLTDDELDEIEKKYLNII